MNHYFSTFISGFQEVVEIELKKRFKDIEVLTLLDGLVVYQTSASFDKIQQLRFLNNSFILLSIMKCSKKQNSETLISKLLKTADFRRAKAVSTLPFVNFFRVTVSKENQTQAVSSKILGTVEQEVSKRLGLKIHRTRPDIEFWFITRKEKLCLFGARITPLGKAKVKKYEEGELRQELAHLLILLSQPKKEDVVLDPFAGSGAIPIERTKGFPYKQIIIGDIVDKKVQLLKNMAKVNEKIKIQRLDALDLKEIEDNSIDKIITDPPWGNYERPQENMEEFYHQMLGEFFRVLKKNGKVILLSGRGNKFDDGLSKSEFKLNRKMEILVSGQKASVYELLV